MKNRHHSLMQPIVWFACMLCMLIWAPRTLAQDANPCTATTVTISLPSTVTISANAPQGPIGTAGNGTVSFSCPTSAFYSLVRGTYNTTLQTNISGASGTNASGQTLYPSGITGISVVLTPATTASNGAAVPPPSPIGNGVAGGNGRNSLVTLVYPGTPKSNGSPVNVTVGFTAQLYVTGTVTSGGTTTLTSLISSFQNYTYGVNDSNATPYGALNVNTVTVNVASCKANSPTVVLPTVTTAALTASGATTGVTPFSLNITGCPAGTQLAITFSGTQSGTSTTVLKSTGTAANVGVQMLNSAGTAVDITGTQATSLGTIPSSGAVTVPYSAEYYATGRAGAGTVTATATFTLSYP
jgi:type 1 fimbria pilin